MYTNIKMLLILHSGYRHARTVKGTESGSYLNETLFEYVQSNCTIISNVSTWVICTDKGDFLFNLNYFCYVNKPAEKSSFSTEIFFVSLIYIIIFNIIISFYRENVFFWLKSAIEY